MTDTEILALVNEACYAEGLGPYDTLEDIPRDVRRAVLESYHRGFMAACARLEATFAAATAVKAPA